MNPVSLQAASVVPDWSETYDAETAPIEFLALAALVVPWLLAGDDPRLEALREQYERAVVRRVQVTGSGFFVDYEIADEPDARPVHLTGGHVKIPIEGLPVPEGCRLLVRHGRIATFEAFIP